MRKYLNKLAAAIVVTSAISSVYATEFRAPLTTERGPLRYYFEEYDKDSYRLKFWSTMYSRESHKAFLKHGTNSEPLTALFFNEADFRLSQIFPNSHVPIKTEFYNPYMRVMTISPRATYHERGATFGGKVDFPVYEEKGRVGVRVNIPWRDIKIEKESAGSTSRDDAQHQDLVVKEEGTPLQFRSRGTTGTNGVDQVVAGSSKRGYRFDLVEALPMNMAGDSMVVYENNAGGNPGQVKIADQSAFEDASESDVSGFVSSFAGVLVPQMFIVASPEGTVPRNNKLGEVISKQNPFENSVTPPMTPVPADLNIPATSDLNYAFNAIPGSEVSYANLAQDDNPNEISTSASALCQRKLIQDRKANLWVTTVHDVSGDLSFSANNPISAIEDALKAFDENVFEWMHDRGFDFESHKLMGIGDIDVDVYYEHHFSKDTVLEGFIGVRFPTGNGSKYHDNPYRVHLGNGEHFEIRLGLTGAWQPLDWMNAKLDATWSFVLESNELRTAGFKGACIKNIGPCCKTDVDWGHLEVNVDFNFFHTQDKRFSSMFGYQFYFKTEDDVHQKTADCNNKKAAWFGRSKIVNITTTTTSPADPGTIDFTDLLFDLDNKVLENNTEGIAHRIRWESGYRFSDWIEGYLGGSWTFAGQNIAREVDLHGGIRVQFE